MKELDWSTFTRRIDVNKSLETLYKAWCSQEAIESWFLKDAHFFKNGVRKNENEIIEAGDTYRWTWYGSDHIAEGEILEMNGKDLVKFTFLGCTVTVTFLSLPETNIVELEQSEIATDDESKMGYYVECTRGWTFFMANLKSILEGGIDLRNKHEGLRNMINT